MGEPMKVTVVDTCEFCGEIADRTNELTESGVFKTSGGHPMVGIGTDVDGDGKADGPMRGFVCCDACWRDPAHRKNSRKVHFFPRDQAAVALAVAGSRAIG